MPIEGGRKFEFADGRPLEEARFCLKDADVLMLRRFLAQAQDLRETIERHGGFVASFKATWQESEPLLITGTEPSSDQRTSVLHRLRPFLHQNELHRCHVIVVSSKGQRG